MENRKPEWVRFKAKVFHKEGNSTAVPLGTNDTSPMPSFCSCCGSAWIARIENGEPILKFGGEHQFKDFFPDMTWNCREGYYLGENISAKVLASALGIEDYECVEIPDGDMTHSIVWKKVVAV